MDYIQRFWKWVEIKPENLPEKIIWYYIIGTYILYFLGAQHLLAPLVGWGLTLYLCKKLWEQTKETPEEEKIRIPLAVWVWIICMLLMCVALVIGLVDFAKVSPVQLIKSTINAFLRTWALLAVFPLVGCLKIRPKILYRAVCILCLQTLFFIVISIIASKVGVPGLLYTSPLQKINGGGNEYYNIGLYIRDGADGIRLYLFAPWAPALGFIGCIYFFLARQESNKVLRWIGMFGAASMVWFSASRLGIICIILVTVLTWFLANFTRPLVQMGTGVASLFCGFFGIQIITWLKDFKAQLDGQRARSSEIREILGRIAVYRWQTDAPIWGHAIKEPKGPPITTRKPIGSHHTWFGVLFTQGAVGFIALAIPMLWSFIDLLVKAQKSKVAEVGLSVFLVLFFYSFGENLETLAYFYWPGLVMMGIGFKEKIPLDIFDK